jgi:hypothetical protein
MTCLGRFTEPSREVLTDYRNRGALAAVEVEAMISELTLHMFGGIGKEINNTFLVVTHLQCNVEFSLS